MYMIRRKTYYFIDPLNKRGFFIKLLFFAALVLAFLLIAFPRDSRAADVCACTAVGVSASRSDSLIGLCAIENAMQQQEKNISPYNVEFRLGALYDSRVGSASGGKNENADTAMTARLAAGWQAPMKGNFGLRLDYRGYADFHQDYNQYNMIDQSVSVEPLYKFGSLIFSLPLSFNLTMEDGRQDYNRYAVSPTLTYLIPDTKQALAVYGIGASIKDRDDNESLNEDGKALGGGLAYLYFFADKSRVRLSLDYQHTAYDSRVWQYGTSSSTERRENDTVAAGIDVLYKLSKNLGLFANYTFIHSDSNVDLYEYNRHLVEGGLAISF
jgi:hypothetical protein